MVIGALCWWRKVVLSIWVVWNELCFMGLLIAALCWRGKVVLSVLVVWSKSDLWGWLSVHCVSGERWFLAYGGLEQIGLMGVVIGALCGGDIVVLVVLYSSVFLSERCNRSLLRQPKEREPWHC